MTPTTSHSHLAPGRLARVVGAAAGASAKRPKPVIALWLLLLICCVVGGSVAGTRTLSDAASGSGESGHATRQMQQAGMLNSFDESVIVRSGSAHRTRQAASLLSDRIAHTAHVQSVTSPTRAPSMIRAGGRVALLAVKLRGDPDHESDNVAALEHTVSRTAHSEHGVYIGEAGDGSFTRAETNTESTGMQGAEMLAFPLTLLVLIAAFGALTAAVVPLLLGLTSVGAAMGALGLVSQIAPNGSTTSSVVILIGLAVGVDYSLFYIRRERAERRNGAGPQAALAAASQTVGRAILIAGMTVIIGLAGLLFAGNPIFVSMALGAILVVGIAVLGSLTVLPATLALLGDRIDAGRPWQRLSRGGRAVRRARKTGTVMPGSRARRPVWGRVGSAVTARPRTALVVAVGLLAVLAFPLLSMKIGNPGSADLPHSNRTVAAQRLIDRNFTGGTDVAQLVVSGHGLKTQAAHAKLERIGREGQKLTGGAGGTVSVAVSRSGNTALVNIPVPSGGNNVQDHNVNLLRAVLKPATRRALPGANALLTGDDASNVDFNNQMSNITPLVLAFVLALAFMLLIASFRSWRLALSVIGLNLLSVGAAFGVLTALFQYHWASELFGLRSFGAIVDWLPLFAFVVLFGLSMDYTVLILERATEARSRGASAREAAAEALGATGSTVTSAALVMVCVFASFARVPMISFEQLGIGLAVAIAIDATVVRGVALPSTLALLGEDGLPTAARRRGGVRRAPVPAASVRTDPEAWDDRSCAVALDPVNE